MRQDRLRPGRILVSLVFASGLAFASLASGQDDDPAEQKVVERFLAVLEKNPRRGTALDRVYGYHVERGSLDALVDRYQARTRANPNDGAAWMLIGLVEAQRGHDAQAIAAFREAERLKADDSLAPYYLGQVLVLVGQTDAAVEAFERSLTRKPSRVDLLEIFQALGRVHQRARRLDQALAVWARLEAAFPDDQRVREQIAEALAEEDPPTQALARYESLAKEVKDEFRKIQFTIEAADLKIRLGRSPEALADFEKLLARLDPASWLFKDVRRKVESLFLRSDDLSGLAKYYEAWIARTPDDVDAMARLGKTYAQLGRASDSRSWLDKAVKLAPSRRDLRLALIEQLTEEKKFTEASTEYETLVKAEPANPDLIRDWGRLLLRDTSKPEAIRKSEASAIWKRLATDDVKDPVAIARAADLLRSIEMVDDAIRLYQRAIAAASDPAQYREYLGEYYHQLKRPADALATWRAAPSRTAAENGRLGEVFANFGYRNEALDYFTAAVKLAPEDFELRLKLAQLYLGLDRPLDAINELARAGKLADAPERVEDVLTREIEAYQVTKTLSKQVLDLKAELDAGKAATADRWTRLARLAEADGKPTEAIVAATRATVADPKSLTSWAILAKLQETTGNLGGAVDSNRTLASLDRRNRADYLSSIARLEARLGRKAEALRAGRELLAAAPGNIERHQEFADLCMSLGEINEGLDALRRASRANPSDPKASNNLAEALAHQSRTEEAIELYWRGFGRSKELEAKLGVVSRLADQYLQRNQFDRLVARLERELREPDRKRELALCLAHAYQIAGDLDKARERLESVLATNPRDSALLIQLANLAEAEGDLAASAGYLKQAVEIAPSPDSQSRLANLYLSMGEVDEAEAIWSKLGAADQDADRAFAAIDNLLSHGKSDTVLTLTERLLRKRPDDWDALYREGVALFNLNRPDEAAQRFSKLLDLKTNDDDQGSKARSRRRGGASSRTTAEQPFPLAERRLAVNSIRVALKLDFQRVSTSTSVWMPADFGQARMAALGWLHAGPLAVKVPVARVQPGTDARMLWDQYYLALVRSSPLELYAASVRLAQAFPDDQAAQYAFLTALRSRASLPAGTAPSIPGKTPPLPDDEQAMMLASFDLIQNQRPELIKLGLLDTVMTELKRAGREADASALFVKSADDPKSLDSIRDLIAIAGQQGDVGRLLTLVEKYDRLALASNAPRSTNFNNSPVATEVSLAMARQAEAKNHAAILRIIDHVLNLASRPDAKRPKAPSTLAAARNIYLIYAGPKGTSQSISIDFPTPNAYFDYGSILVLRNAYEIYKRDDLTDELINHFQAQAAQAADGSSRLLATLASSYLLWWNDEKDAAVRDYAKATELAGHDVDLTLNLADLRSQRGELAEALAAADAIEPFDQKSIQRREILVLRLAVQGGDVDRARKAAERLVGLRLDAANQNLVASLLGQLGFSDLSQALTTRTRRRSQGNNNVNQVTLMLQFQAQGNIDQAVQIATQILKQSPGLTGATQTTAWAQQNNNRARAMQVLARSGKLKELIAKAEAQLETAPNSEPLLQTLIEYYQVDGQLDKVRSTYEKMAMVRPDDARHRLQIGLQISLMQGGRPADALEHFRAALKKEPTLFFTQYANIVQTYQRANKPEEFAALLDSIDFKVFANNPTLIQNLIRTLFMTRNRVQELNAPALLVIRKACKEMPESRILFLSHIPETGLWKVPDLYDEVRLAIIPAANQPIGNPWAGFDQVSLWLGDGTIINLTTRLLEGAVSLKKLDTLAAEVDSALKRSPDWVGGQALKGIIALRQGKLDEARIALEPLTAPGVSIPLQARMVIAQELTTPVRGQVGSLDNLALKLLETALTENAVEIQNMAGVFDHGPGKLLSMLYHKAGRSRDARDLVLKSAAMPINDVQFNPAYTASQKINRTLALATLLLEIGFPADAARFYNELASDPRLIEMALPYLGNDEIVIEQIRKGLDKSLQKLDRSTLERSLRTILTSKPNIKPGEDQLDLILLVRPRDIDKARVVSWFAEAILGLKDDKILAAEIGSIADRLVADHPDDLSVLAASALVASVEPGSDSLGSALDRLARWVDAHPLEAWPASGRIHAQQREEARRQLILAVVAREAIKADATRPIGVKLAQRAVEAAARQVDNRWSLAILRESAQAALARGDKAAAEAAWRAMGQRLVAVPAHPDQRSSLAIERFDEVAQLARMAVDEKLPEVSIEILRGALAGGPPISPLNTVVNTRVSVSVANGVRNVRQTTVEPAEPVAEKVEGQLARLDDLWTNAGADRLAIYELLREAVIPQARPNEVFLYNRKFETTPSVQPRSLGAMLARSAVKVGKADELKAALEARKTSPLAARPAKLLLEKLQFEQDKAQEAAKRQNPN